MLYHGEIMIVVHFISVCEPIEGLAGALDASTADEPPR